MTPAIAIVGMACRYPDAQSPGELWENVLAQRRAFRRLPPERLNLEDYLCDDRQATDATYSQEAAVIEGYSFDRVRYRVAGSTFRSVDMAHWLALEVADDALADAGFADGQGLPRDASGVLVGNSLTGEFSRANLMRLRWPYVRRVVDAALAERGWPAQQRAEFLEGLMRQYKAPFPPVGDETLAGGLSNTIAGRICNHFDLGGGGYTVDGACASSLLAVATACSALSAGDLDVAVVGGVDLSLDPFELVGFAKLGALATDEMRVFDARSAGFWPGEGCGFVVLMRCEDALRQNRPIYAVLRGWGISSDGSGGITRPEVEGQLLALRRAYRRCEFPAATVPLFEGHGTGTGVGDRTELGTLSRAVAEHRSQCPPAAIGSIKANIGHTKAAAGVAGLIKAAMALKNQLLPPATGCDRPHPLFAEEGFPLRLLDRGEVWPADRPLRAGVSAMGFGGINAHVVLEAADARRRKALSPREQTLLSSPQDAELMLLSARDRDTLRRRVQRLAGIAAGLSRSELTDLAARLAETLQPGRVRAAVVASTPAQLHGRLDTLGSWLAEGVQSRLDIPGGVMLGTPAGCPAVGLLFPGQGSPANLDGGAWARRFESVADLYRRATLPVHGDGVATEVAQPAVATASLAGLHVLDRLGISAAVAVGHSMGELTAYHWAGAIDEEALLRLVTARGRAIAQFGQPTGAMASVAAGRDAVGPLLVGQPIVVAGLNSPHQTVLSGEASAVEGLVSRARAMGLAAVRLPVSHAFHSPLVADSIPRLAEAIAAEHFHPLQFSVASTVTGSLLKPNEDLPAMLLRQMTSPVRFMEAVGAVADRVDLWIEVGPGEVLGRIAGDLIGRDLIGGDLIVGDLIGGDAVDRPVVSLDSGGGSLRGLLAAAGAAFVCGAAVNHRELFDTRFARPFNPDRKPSFFANPCESAPESQLASLPQAPGLKVHGPKVPEPETSAAEPEPAALDRSPLEVVRRLAAGRAELPLDAVAAGDRLLGDLHLSSLAVGQLAVEAARALGLPPPESPTDAANATIGQLADSLEQLARDGPAPVLEAAPAGVDSWVRTFTVELVPRRLPRRRSEVPCGRCRVIAPPDHPFKDALQTALDEAGQRQETGQVVGQVVGQGVVVCLPPRPDHRHVELLLEGARAVTAEGADGRSSSIFVLVQHGGGGAAFARSLHLEMPQVTTCVVDVPEDDPQSVDWVLAEISAAAGYSEAHYDRCGTRREPELRLLPLPDEMPSLPLDPDDVMLVTGGGKGIAAESAFSLAQATGVRLALLGRSQPAQDAELAANLERITAAGVQFRYVSADVSDRAAVEAAVRDVETSWGPITAVLHGAGTNTPQRLDSLDKEAFLRTLRPKVRGAQNVLAAVNPDTLRLLITFGSIIARTGMHGQADYALANQWLARLTEDWQAEHPHCHCLALEWSVWSGVGMGERLGTVDSLRQQGITPIPPEEGIRLLQHLIGHTAGRVAVVVTGRFGQPPTIRLERPELPLLRFIERPRVHVPGVELVAEADLSTDTDPYLKDHVYQDLPLLPAVVGLEAMAQAAMALTGWADPPDFEQVELRQPVVVPEGQRVTVRLAVLVQGPDRVEVVLRSQETGFQTDHFRATCRPVRRGAGRPPKGVGRPAELLAEIDDAVPPVPIAPQRDLYGGILFHCGRFRRLSGYRHLRATQCIAEISSGGAADWFGQYLPARLVLGDPAGRDAVIHAVQACIPHGTLLPIGVEKLQPAAEMETPAVVRARERSRDGDLFVYDLEVTGTDGTVRERWEGLRLRRVGESSAADTWAEPLLGAYIERRLGELIPGAHASVVVQRNGAAQRRASADLAVRRAVGASAAVYRRPDGKPEVCREGEARDGEVSVAHTEDLTMAVAGPGVVACDAEPVTQRPAKLWPELLGPQRSSLAGLIADRTAEDRNTAATRVWAAAECLKKAHAPHDAPLVLRSTTDDHWVLMAAGRLTVATWVTPIRHAAEKLALAVLIGGNDAGI